MLNTYNYINNREFKIFLSLIFTSMSRICVSKYNFGIY